jgi:ABC-type multidrug transport system ATPase subunit
MLEIRGLRKTYPGGIEALKGVSLEVSPGVFGLLGPNGAGKTTLMKILATLLEPDEGRVRVGGVDFVGRKRAARRMLGYLPQEFGLYPSLTAEQTLHYFARLKGVADARERALLVGALLERVNLADARRQQVGGFSGGMRQRLGIAQVLIGQPRLIIVDEPTAGLDPEERNRFHNLLSEIAGDETVVLLSTHIVSDVSTLCGALAVMRRGEIVASDTPRAALERLAGSVWEAAVPREQVAALKGRLKVLSTSLFEGRVRVKVLSRAGRPGEEFAQASPTLEDYYFNLVSHAGSAN